MFDEISYYAKQYKCLNNNRDWIDQHGNYIRYTCECGGKTIPLFDVTHALVTAQCRECYKIYSSMGEIL